MTWVLAVVAGATCAACDWLELPSLPTWARAKREAPAPPRDDARAPHPEAFTSAVRDAAAQGSARDRERFRCVARAQTAAEREACIAAGRRRE